MEPVERISADSHNQPKKLYKLCLSIVLVVESQLQLASTSQHEKSISALF